MTTRPRRQCAKCPWKVGADPSQIPRYQADKHEGLHSTIAAPADLSSRLRIMACHETYGGNDKPCVGWMAHQLGPGNNIPLRLAVMTGRIDGNVQTVGPQHGRFEDTLPSARGDA